MAEQNADAFLRRYMQIKRALVMNVGRPLTVRELNTVMNGAEQWREKQERQERRGNTPGGW